RCHPIIELMSKHPGRTARVLATIFFMTTVALSVALVLSWKFFYKLALKPLPEPDLPSYAHPSDEPVSPLQIHYQLDLPGRGEIFPALSGSQAADYWPVAVLSISNTAARSVFPGLPAQGAWVGARLSANPIIRPHRTPS